MRAIPLLLINCLLSLYTIAQVASFYGPFASWCNVKTMYHAVGDGIHDDTKEIQAALNDLGKGNHSPVLYFPNGTYLISNTLTMKARIHIAILGEDPLHTIIQWNGDTGKKMFQLNGVAYSEYGRITWDGNNKAYAAVAHEWDGKTGHANSGTQHSDEIFRNIGTGLKSGMNMDAEFSIRRCRFYNCSSTGISLQGWNALDWWIWDCFFDSCHAGVSNNFPGGGAGNFHIYRSIFKNSTYADISLGNSNYFSFRNNISYHSNAFIKAIQNSNTSPITIQNNTIIHTKNVVMADMQTKGNLLFLDNIFISPDSNYNNIIQHVDYWDGSNVSLAMIGNKFTAKRKIFLSNDSNVINIDNETGIKAPAIPALLPTPFAAIEKYLVFELTDSMTDTAIQAIINQAARKNKTAIIHFKYGSYKIKNTLHIPGGAPLIILGDGMKSILGWAGPDSAAVIQVDFPSKCSIKNIKITCNKKADGIILIDNDKEGNTVYANQLMTYFGVKNNIAVNGFANTGLRFENLQHNYSKSNSIKMTGTNKPNATIFKIFGAVGVENTNSYTVDSNGRILAYDVWYEDSRHATFLELKNSGEFILNGGKIANVALENEPFVNMDNFTGKVVLTQIIFNTKGTIQFSNKLGKAAFLSIGNLSWRDSTLNFYRMESLKEKYALLNNRYNLGKGSYPVPNAGDNTPAFTKEMLATIRSTSVLPAIKTRRNTTSFILDRVMIENGINNFRMERSR